MRAVFSSWLPALLGLIVLSVILIQIFASPAPVVLKQSMVYDERRGWTPPDMDELPWNDEGNMVRYGQSLIANTAFYFGPKGIIARASNGMNCQNCHLDAGGRLYANPFSAVSSTYPKFRERSGRVESVAFRINECMQRSLNGNKLDSAGREMQAMIAYVKWMSSYVPKDVVPKGTGTQDLPLLKRAADPARGKSLYLDKCARCHAANGEGALATDSASYIYPPLWGVHSYNVSAGFYRISKLAGFIRNNMPFGTSYETPELTDEQAWDVAAYINSQPRTERRFDYDYRNVSKKPFDYPFGPYADDFTEQQHKYGPFEPIQKKKVKP